MNLYISRMPKMTDWDEYGKGAARDFVRKMLFEEKKLRQGWGFSTYDLRVDKDTWVQRAMANPMGRDSQSTDIKENAQKRYSILSTMLSVQHKDIIIIPYINDKNLYDRNIFTIVTATDSYNFEDRSKFNEGYEQDFGHFISIDNIQCFSQSDFNINFGAYQKSFNRVHQQKIKDNVNNFFKPK